MIFSRYGHLFNSPLARQGVCFGKGSSGGGGAAPPQQTTSTVNQSNLPEYARPYFESLMGRSQQVSNDPYQAYTGDRIAPLTSQQQGAFNAIDQNIGSYEPGFGQASANFSQAGNFNPSTVTNTYQGNNLTPANWTDQGVSQSYMSPYMQNVTDIGKREATRDFNIQQQGRNTQAQRGGAFGGTRAAVLDAEANRNLNMQMQDIQDKGLQSAYNTGLGAFNQDRSSQIGANQLNNQFGQQASQMGMAATGANNQYGLQSSQNQIGVGQAYAGLGQATQQAGLTDAQSLLNTGAIQQAQTQTGYDTAYSDFVNQRDYNRQNLNWLSGILRGVPVSANTSTTGYTAPPSTVSQIAGLGLGAAGLSKLIS